MEDQNISITLDVSEAQLDTINHLFSHYGWNYNEVNRGETAGNLSYSFGPETIQLHKPHLKVNMIWR